MDSSSRVNHLSQPCIFGSGQYGSSGYADRKSRFMKWIGKVFKGGPSLGRTNGRRSQLLGEDNMILRAPSRSMDDRSRTNEDLDHAMALSLTENSRKPNGCKRSTDHDEDLARALQDSLNMPPYPRAPPQFFPGGYRFCGGCNREIGSTNYLGCMGTFWHPECFCCLACSQPITDHEFSLSGTRLPDSWYAPVRGTKTGTRYAY